MSTFFTTYSGFLTVVKQTEKSIKRDVFKNAHLHALVFCEKCLSLPNLKSTNLFDVVNRSDVDHKRLRQDSSKLIQIIQRKYPLQQTLGQLNAQPYIRLIQPIALRLLWKITRKTQYVRANF